MEYTSTIENVTYDRPIGTFDQNGRVVYNNYEHYDIDVINVVMQSKIENNEDVKKLAETLYPEVVSTLGDNQYMGIRIELDRNIKTVFAQGDSLKDFEKSLLRQYSAMRLDIDIFGLTKEDL